MLNEAVLVAFIATTDARRAKAFYGDTLGLLLRDESDFALVFDASGTELRIQKVGEFTPHGFTALGWQVPSIDATVAHLAQRGIATERYPWMTQDDCGIWSAPGGARIAWFKDPDGNLVSVAEYS